LKHPLLGARDNSGYRSFSSLAILENWRLWRTVSSMVSAWRLQIVKRNFI